MSTLPPVVGVGLSAWLIRDLYGSYSDRNARLCPDGAVCRGANDFVNQHVRDVRRHDTVVLSVAWNARHQRSEFTGDDVCERSYDQRHSRLHIDGQQRYENWRCRQWWAGDLQRKRRHEQQRRRARLCAIRDGHGDGERQRFEMAQSDPVDRYLRQRDDQRREWRNDFELDWNRR